MPNPITRESFISPDIDKVAISKETMFVVSENGENVVEVPMLESIKSSGIIPEEYAVGFHLDPATVISALAKTDVTTIEQLPDGALEKIREVINSADNVSISPRDVVESARAAMENALKMPMEESNEESEEVSEGNTSAKSDDESDNTDDKHE